MRLARTVRSACDCVPSQLLQQKKHVLLQPLYKTATTRKIGELDPPCLPVPDPRRRRPDLPVLSSPWPNHVEEGLPHLSSGLEIASIMSYICNDLLASMDLGSNSAAVHGRSPLRRQGPGGSGPCCNGTTTLVWSFKMQHDMAGMKLIWYYFQLQP